MPRRAIALPLLLSLCASGAGAQRTVNLATVCGPTTLLRLVGVDTRDGSALLAFDDTQGAVPGWLLEVTAAPAAARLRPDDGERDWFGGSVGPGPVLGFERCGAGCLQPLRWEEGWQPIGPALDAPEGATVHATWDAGGRPWVVLHLAGERPGGATALAFVLQGDRWASGGSRVVRAVGSPAAVPDPRSNDAVVSGTGRFRASREPEDWIDSLPRLETESGAGVLPDVDGGALLLTAEAALYRASATGAWSLQRWLPWARDGRRTALWRPGRDYWIDRPSGDAVSGSPLLWYDDRDADAPSLWLTEGLGPELEVVGRLPRAGSDPAVEHVLRFSDGRWLALGPCAARSPRAVVPAWTSDGRRWRQLPIEPAW